MGERTPSTGNSEIGAENILLADLTSILSQIMNKTLTTATQETLAAPIDIKQEDSNYGLWSQVVEMYISGKDKLGYINGDLPQPQETDPSFRKWRTENVVVKSWLINSMDAKLISNYIRFPTTDTSQVYDLKRKVTRIRQGEGSIETYYNNLQGLWREINFRRPNSMKCKFDIEKYNSILQEDRVYTFLDGLDDRLDKIRGDVLQLKPFPTVEQAYVHVRREDLRQSVMLTKDDIVHSAVMISKGQKSQQQPSLQLALNGKQNFLTKPKSQGEEVGCTHCGHPKHTRDTCFKLHGYPKWWHDLKEKMKRDVGRAALVNTGDTSVAASTEPQLSFIPQQGVLPATANTTRALDNPGVMEDDVIGSICGQDQSIQSIEEEQFLLPNSEHREGMVTALIVYVDDMIITGDDEQEITNLQEYLATEFEMKNLGGLKYFLGIEVARSTQGIFLSQRKYVLDLLAETWMLECKPADTPIVQYHGLREHQGQIPTNKERYQRLVGKLIYLSHTRPDIAFVVSLVSQFMHNPNADWAGNATDRRSTSGYFTFVGGNLVTWRSKKQNVVALSSAEAEFRGMAKGLCELLWLKGLLAEIGHSSKSSMNMFCDSKSAIQIAENPVQHDRTKHVEVDRHFIKEKLKAKIICFPFVKLEEQLADILTKAVPSKVFHNSLDKLDIRDIYAPT
ncbi:hypothetical protein RJ640_027148 [Escallonia rubra]|uniref:Reverse transcriptase Ty1/copia-type domain-containing protein n=1 Tax=Escallonia rubra TaxID=112253 RepID=A0AA88QPI5_9ASTE|nr:hypothetical protein RJ640_027148 [Escallonia rubra]